MWLLNIKPQVTTSENTSSKRGVFKAPERSPYPEHLSYPGVNRARPGMIKTAPNLIHVRQTCQAHLLELQKEMVVPPTFGHATESIVQHERKPPCSNCKVDQAVQGSKPYPCLRAHLSSHAQPGLEHRAASPGIAGGKGTKLGYRTRRRIYLRNHF